MRNLIINLFFSHIDDLAYPTFAIFFSCLGFLGYFGVDVYYTVTSAVFNHEHRSEKDDFEKLDEI